MRITEKTRKNLIAKCTHVNDSLYTMKNVGYEETFFSPWEQKFTTSMITYANYIVVNEAVGMCKGVGTTCSRNSYKHEIIIDMDKISEKTARILTIITESITERKCLDYPLARKLLEKAVSHYLDSWHTDHDVNSLEFSKAVDYIMMKHPDILNYIEIDIYDVLDDVTAILKEKYTITYSEIVNLIKENMKYDTRHNCYHGYNRHGNDVLVSLEDGTIYACVTDDPDNDCRGYSTDIDISEVRRTGTELILGGEDISIDLQKSRTANF